MMEVPYCQDLDYYGLSSIKSQLFSNVLVSVEKELYANRNFPSKNLRIV